MCCAALSVSEFIIITTYLSKRSRLVGSNKCADIVRD